MSNKKIRIFYIKPDGFYSSADYPFKDFEQAQKLVTDFERDNGVRVLDVSYFPNWHPGITGGVRLAFNLQLFREYDFKHHHE